MEAKYRGGHKAVEMRKRHFIKRSIPPREGGPAFDHVEFTSPAASHGQKRGLGSSKSATALPAGRGADDADAHSREHAGRSAPLLRGTISVVATGGVGAETHQLLRHSATAAALHASPVQHQLARQGSLPVLGL